MRSMSTRSIAIAVLVSVVIGAVIALIASIEVAAAYMNIVFWGGLGVIVLVWLALYLASPPPQFSNEALYDRAKYGRNATQMSVESKKVDAP
jgi:uncharacterized membrane protein YjfL (UPF0719 family)